MCGFLVISKNASFWNADTLEVFFFFSYLLYSREKKQH